MPARQSADSGSQGRRLPILFDPKQQVAKAYGAPGRWATTYVESPLPELKAGKPVLTTNIPGCVVKYSSQARRQSLRSACARLRGLLCV